MGQSLDCQSCSELAGHRAVLKPSRAPQQCLRAAVPGYGAIQSRSAALSCPHCHVPTAFSSALHHDELCEFYPSSVYRAAVQELKGAAFRSSSKISRQEGELVAILGTRRVHQEGVLVLWELRNNGNTRVWKNPCFVWICAKGGAAETLCVCLWGHKVQGAGLAEGDLGCWQLKSRVLRLPEGKFTGLPGLCFALVAGRVLITERCSGYCPAALSLCHSFPQQRGWEWAGSWQGTQPGQRTQISQGDVPTI